MKGVGAPNTTAKERNSMPEFNPITIAKDRQKVFQELLDMTWGELEAIEFNDRLLFPHTIVRIRAGGKREKIPVMLRVPREPETRAARIKAREWAQDIGLNPQLDPDLFDNLDTMVVLADAIRNTAAPHEPWVPDPRELEAQYDRPSLEAAWARLEALRRVIDPRTDELDEESFLALVAMIAKKAEIDPLVALDSDGQTSFIVRMAVRLQSYQESK